MSSASPSGGSSSVWYRDPDTLRELYWGEGMSSREIAAGSDVTYKTILYWMDKLGIERREKTCFIEEKNAGNLPYFEQADSGGHERWQVGDGGDLASINTHRLIAVAEFGLPAISGMVVHHRNHIPWDNRPSNLKIMTRKEHSSHHRRFALGEADYDDDHC